MAKAPKLKITPELQAVAERFRSERRLERFGQAELAQEIGVTRPTVSNFEYGLARVTFAAGYAFCRRLDINPHWLATGEGQKRPFVEPTELGLKQSDIDRHLQRGVDFLSGYRAVLERPLTAWIKKTPLDEIIGRQIGRGPKLLAQRFSNSELESKLVEMAGLLRKEKDSHLKLAWLANAEAMLTELKARLLTRHPESRELFK